MIDHILVYTYKVLGGTISDAAEWACVVRQALNHTSMPAAKVNLVLRFNDKEILVLNKSAPKIVEEYFTLKSVQS